MGVIRVGKALCDREAALQLTTELTPAYKWDKCMLTVVRDGYTEYGVRIHFVTEDIKDGTIIANAVVFGNYKN